MSCKGCTHTYTHANEGIKNFIVAIIIKTSSDEQSLDRNRTLLGKLSIVLVQVIQNPIKSERSEDFDRVKRVLWSSEAAKEHERSELQMRSI